MLKCRAFYRLRDGVGRVRRRDPLRALVSSCSGASRDAPRHALGGRGADSHGPGAARPGLESVEAWGVGGRRSSTYEDREPESTRLRTTPSHPPGSLPSMSAFAPNSVGWRGPAQFPAPLWEEQEVLAA